HERGDQRGAEALHVKSRHDVGNDDQAQGAEEPAHDQVQHVVASSSVIRFGHPNHAPGPERKRRGHPGRRERTENPLAQRASGLAHHRRSNSEHACWITSGPRAKKYNAGISVMSMKRTSMALKPAVRSAVTTSAGSSSRSSRLWYLS